MTPDRAKTSPVFKVDIQKAESDYQEASPRVDREIKRVGFKHPAIVELVLSSPSVKKLFLELYPEFEPEMIQGVEKATRREAEVGHSQDTVSIAELWYIVELSSASDDSYFIPTPDEIYVNGYEELVRKVTLTDSDVDKEILRRREDTVDNINAFFEELVRQGKGIKEAFGFVKSTEPRLKRRFFEFQEGMVFSRDLFILNTLMNLRGQLLARKFNDSPQS